MPAYNRRVRVKRIQGIPAAGFWSLFFGLMALVFSMSILPSSLFLFVVFFSVFIFSLIAGVYFIYKGDSLLLFSSFAKGKEDARLPLFLNEYSE